MSLSEAPQMSLSEAPQMSLSEAPQMSLSAPQRKLREEVLNVSPQVAKELVTLSLQRRDDRRRWLKTDPKMEYLYNRLAWCYPRETQTKPSSSRVWTKAKLKCAGMGPAACYWDLNTKTGTRGDQYATCKPTTPFGMAIISHLNTLMERSRLNTVMEGVRQKMMARHGERSHLKTVMEGVHK
jgi:hypothetical protein